MDNSKNINWLNIILNAKFQNEVQFKTLVEVSMVSKIAREKLKPLVFKRIGIYCSKPKFISNVFFIAIEQQFKSDKFHSTVFAVEKNKSVKSAEFDYHTLKENHRDCIQDSFNEYKAALNYIGSYSRQFRLSYAKNSGYYLYHLINGFNNLTRFSIFDCNIPFAAFADIGKALPNLTSLELYIVNLVKLPTETIKSSDLSFPLKLRTLSIRNSQVATTDLLLDPYEYLFNRKSNNYTYEQFILPKHPLPLLKRLGYDRTKNFQNSETNGELEEFININPKLESLGVQRYNLKIDSILNLPERLCVDDSICFNNISNISNLDSIHTLNFTLRNFGNTENFSKLCQLCPNLVELNLFISDIFSNPQALVDGFLTPALPNLSKLKTLYIIGHHNNRIPVILDFTNFIQI
jgi:hypothetical protein